MRLRNILWAGAIIGGTLSSQASAQTADDIVVNGRRYPSPRIFDYVVPGVNIGTSNDIVLFAGDDGQPVTNIHACTRTNAKREAGKDKLSDDFKEALALTGDATSREYATIMIMNTRDSANPTFRYEPIARGMTYAEADRAGLDAPQTVIPAPVSQQYDYIVGIIHSHPSVGSPDLLGNRLPSGNDWDTYATLSRNYPMGSPSGARTAPAYAFSRYIVGPDGRVREYRQDAGKPRTATNGILNRC